MPEKIDSDNSTSPSCSGEVQKHPEHSSSEFHQLIEAIASNNLDAVLRLLAAGKQGNLTYLRDCNGRLPLHYAAESCSKELFAKLFEKDCSTLDVVDDYGYTPLTIAIIGGNQDVVKFLLEKGADANYVDNDKHSMVQWATVCQQADVLELLLNEGTAIVCTPDMCGAQALHYATMESEDGTDNRASEKILHILLKHGANVNCSDMEDRTPLLWAASNGSVAAVTALIEAGADKLALDKDGLSAAHCAASRGQTGVIEYFLKIAPDPLAVLESCDRNGATPLFYAVTLGHIECAKLMLIQGAKPNRQDKRLRCAAHYASAKGQLQALKLLRQYGASFEIQNYRGDLPLHEAVQAGSIECVEWLLSLHPGTVNSQNHEGRSCLHLAAAAGNLAMCKLLCNKGAVVNALMLHKSDLATSLDLAEKKSHQAVLEYLKTEVNASKAAELPSDLIKLTRSRLELRFAEAQSTRPEAISATDQSSDDKVTMQQKKSSNPSHKKHRRRVSRELKTKNRQMQTSLLSLHEKGTNTDSDTGGAINKTNKFPTKGVLKYTNPDHSEAESCSTLPQSSAEDWGILGVCSGPLQTYSMAVDTSDLEEMGQLDQMGQYSEQEDIDDAAGINRKILLKSVSNRSTAERYTEEKKIFQELTHLKRMQIEFGRVQESVLVKRLVEQFCKQNGIDGSNFVTFHTFNDWEKFLYDQLKLLYLEERERLMRSHPSKSNASSFRGSEFDRRFKRPTFTPNRNKIEQITKTYGVVRLPSTPKPLAVGTLKRCGCLETGRFQSAKK